MKLDNNTSTNRNRSAEKAPLDQLSMVSFITDLPNICTLSGLFSATLGIYLAITGYIDFAVICGAWCVLFDWMDGLIASKITTRTDKHKAFGGQLDSLVDIVSFGVLPAFILLSYSGFNPWFLPGAFIMISACAIRLSYFNIYGLKDGKTYTGLAVDNNGIIVAIAFLFEHYFTPGVFSIVLYIVLMAVVFFNLSTIQIPKFSKKAIYGIAAFVLFVTVYFSV